MAIALATTLVVALLTPNGASTIPLFSIDITDPGIQCGSDVVVQEGGLYLFPPFFFLRLSPSASHT
jgi:hypothetical protein